MEEVSPVVPYCRSIYHLMNAFGSIDPAALTVAVIEVLYAMKETLSEWNSNLERWIGDQVLITYQTACAPNGSETILKFLTEVGNGRHSRYRCDGVTIKELKFAIHIIKYCQIWKMAWWIDIVLMAGLVIQIFPPPFKLFLWATIMLLSSPIAGFTKIWDRATSKAAYKNLGEFDGYKILLSHTPNDYIHGNSRTLEHGIEMVSYRRGCQTDYFIY
jgi:hypothetical protein